METAEEQHLREERIGASRRAIPPAQPFSSIKIVDEPFLAAATAAQMPLGPPPTTATSASNIFDIVSVNIST